MRNLQKDFCGLKVETDKPAGNIQARSFMARTLERNGKECKAEGEAQNGPIEKPKLDNARRLRGIHFIDPEDMEFKEIIKNARRKSETPIAPAMPCKTCKNNKHGETRRKTDDFKSKFACILEASESTRIRVEECWLRAPGGGSKHAFYPPHHQFRSRVSWADLTEAENLE